MSGEEGADKESAEKVYEIYENIREGAKAFLFAEYSVCIVFIVIFGMLVAVTTAHTGQSFNWTVGTLTATSFAVGGITSIISGYIGMMVAVFSNARTTLQAAADGEFLTAILIFNQKILKLKDPTVIFQAPLAGLDLSTLPSVLVVSWVSPFAALLFLCSTCLLASSLSLSTWTSSPPWKERSRCAPN